jgi:hypothetical protein
MTLRREPEAVVVRLKIISQAVRVEKPLSSCPSRNWLDRVISGENPQKASSKMKPFWLGARNIREEFHKPQGHLRGGQDANGTGTEKGAGSGRQECTS